MTAARTRHRMLLFGWLLSLAVPAAATALAEQLVDAAAAQVGVTTGYDPSYRRLDFPGGDVPPDTGVCTDVVIRAYRAVGIDLQVDVHEDMRRGWDDYPKLWGLTATDRNIDHRRVPNLQQFFRRAGASLPLGADADAYQPGDIVTWRLPSGVPHIGVVSSQRVDGRPAIIHNIGAGAQIEDVLFAWPVTGHYRYPTR